MHAALHKGCGGVIGHYHGDPSKGLHSSEFFSNDRRAANANRIFPAFCLKCKMLVHGVAEIEWRNCTPADDEQGLGDWNLMPPEEDDD